MKKVLITNQNKILDLTNIRFGRLVVTDKIKRCKSVLKRLCICDCGNETWVSTHKLVNGHTKSCGCYRKSFRKLAYGIATRNEILDDYKRGAKKRNLIWDLTEGDFDKLITSRCYFCNTQPSTLRVARRNNGDFTYNGIDRLDNDIGYVRANTVSCCKTCNRAKSDMSLRSFKIWIEDIIKNNK